MSDLEPFFLAVYFNYFAKIVDKTSFDFDISNLVPLMKSIIHNDDNYHNGETIFEHTVHVIEDLEKVRPAIMDKETLNILNLAALFHDVGKAFTYQYIDGKHTFRGHNDVSVAIAKAFLDHHDMTLDKQRVLDLIEHHDAFMVLHMAKKNAKGLSYLSKFMRGPIYKKGHMQDLIILSKADSYRSKINNETNDSINQIIEDIEEVERFKIIQAKKKEAELKAFETKENEVRALLVEESGALLNYNLKSVRTALGSKKRYDLLKSLKMMLES